MGVFPWFWRVAKLKDGVKEEGEQTDHGEGGFFKEKVRDLVWAWSGIPEGSDLGLDFVGGDWEEEVML